ncbi:MAG: response regulator [Myxococcales bacterium]|nr:response regulator [Myxococcales bacterium]MDD9969836.1 response regulator [Myxococcales bacterium]
MGLRILIVDDSSAMRAYVRATLEDSFGATVEEATSGFEALRVLPRERFDLVVVDINMPNINGLELISFMRRSETHKETPLVIISTEASKRDRERAFSLGANAYLAKPFTSEQLLETLEQFRTEG